MGANTQHSAGLVEIDLTHIPPSTEATLVVRLVNNDNDTLTRVTISDVAIAAGSLGTPLGVTPIAATISAAELLDTRTLSDVTASMLFQFGATSFNAQERRLFADVAVQSAGILATAAPLLVVIDQVSDPSIVPLNADGRTADGKPYYDFTSLVSGGRLEPGQQTGFGTLSFLNPNGIQFDFELAVLAQLNRVPEISSSPPLEALVGKRYSYAVQVDDSDSDPLAFSLAAATEGMVINSESGLIEWTPAAADDGTHTIIVRVDDGRGGADEQSFTLEVRDTVPNRPPNFTSDPPVDATVAAFFEVVDVPVGDNPVGVAIGDFTGFGSNSIVSVNQNDQTVSLAMGLGRERFEPSQVLGVGEPPSASRGLYYQALPVDLAFPTTVQPAGSPLHSVLGVARGDFNGDGFLDLAATLQEHGAATGVLDVLLGRGDGTFAPPLQTRLAIVGNALVSRDFDGNGTLDLVIGGFQTPQMLYLAGQGDGTFADPISIHSVGRPEIVLADVDGVNGPDLIASNASLGGETSTGRFSVRLNNGNGQFSGAPDFQSTGIAAAALSIQVADYDGDSRLDVFAAGINGDQIFYPGNGDGTFGNPVIETGNLIGQPILRGVENVATDLNGDGLPDAFFGSNLQFNQIVASLSRGDGTFETIRYVPSPGSGLAGVNEEFALFSSVVPGDFNSDGVMDLAVGSRRFDDRGGLTILLGEQPGRFQAPRVYDNLRTSGRIGSILGDFNNDGHLDLVSITFPVDIRFGLGDGTFGESIAAAANISGPGEFLGCPLTPARSRHGHR